MVDVSISHTIKEGDPFISLGAGVGDTCFIISYSDPEEECGGGRVELFAKNRQDAENWKTRIECNWVIARQLG